MTTGLLNRLITTFRLRHAGAWGSLMDVGGGNGILLSHILRAHRGLRGILADQDHVLE